MRDQGAPDEIGGIAGFRESRKHCNILINKMQSITIMLALIQCNLTVDLPGKL